MTAAANVSVCRRTRPVDGNATGQIPASKSQARAATDQARNAGLGRPARAAYRRSQEYAWHCAPFTEGAQYGIEVFYPYDNELRVSRKSGKLVFDGEFGPRPENSGDLMWPPFRSFGQDYYTYQLLLDLKVAKDWAVRTEPHPRFYTDPTDTVPIAVPALLRTEWWPMISFVVFKSPVEGHTHIFRPGEPILQILILPVIADFALAPMDEEEAA